MKRSLLRTAVKREAVQDLKILWLRLFKVKKQMKKKVVQHDLRVKKPPRQKNVRVKNAVIKNDK